MAESLIAVGQSVLQASHPIRKVQLSQMGLKLFESGKIPIGTHYFKPFDFPARPHKPELVDIKVC